MLFAFFLGYPKLLTKANVDSEFKINLNWIDVDNVEGNLLLLETKENVNINPKMRVSYESATIREKGYEAGELTILVKGIGKIAENEIITPLVGADKYLDENKTRDWSYTYNSNSDTFVLTNNNKIEGNTVLYGYFDIVYNIPARKTINNYYVEDIQAGLMTVDGDKYESQKLKLLNKTYRDIHTVDISRGALYSVEGLENTLWNLNTHFVIKYNLNTYVQKKSRALKSQYCILNIDTEKNQTEGFVFGGNISYVPMENGKYRINNLLPEKEGYVYVAYPRTYLGSEIGVSLKKFGQYNGEDEELLLNQSEHSFYVERDFSFSDISGSTYNFKYTTTTDTEIGEQLKHNKIVNYYFSGDNKVTPGDTSDIEFVADMFYALGEFGGYKKLTSADYHFKSVTIPNYEHFFNINNINVEKNKYVVKIYAGKNGSKIEFNPDNLIHECTIDENSHYVSFAEDVTSIGIKIEGLTESIIGYRIPIEVDFHIQNEEVDFKKGTIVGLSFIKRYVNNQWVNNNYTEQEYDDTAKLNLAENDLMVYGSYLDRERASFNLTELSKNILPFNIDIKNPNIDSISSRNWIYPVTHNIKLYKVGNETIDKFSIYTILPKHFKLANYDYLLKEEIKDEFNIKIGEFGLEEIAKMYEVSFIQNHKGKDYNLIRFDFDLKDKNIYDELNIDISFNCEVSERDLKDIDFVFNLYSVMILNNNGVLFDNKKLEKDNGLWFPEDISFANDIDNDGNTEESIIYRKYSLKFLRAGHSQMSINKYIKTTLLNYNSNTINSIEMDSNYSYMLSFVNGSNMAKNLIFIDKLETDDESECRGEFKSIDLSLAESLGANGTVYYSEKESPNNDLKSSDWVKELEPKKVKSIAVDFGDFLLSEGKTISVVVNMHSPNDNSLKGKTIENKYLVSGTLISSDTLEETELNFKESNSVKGVLTPPLKNVVIKKVDKDTGNGLFGAKFVLKEKGKFAEIQSVYTSGTGIGIFKNLDSEKEYVIQEDIAPIGYELDSNEYPIIFSDEKILNIEIPNVKKKGKVELIKKNKLDKDLPVENAEYGIYTPDGELVKKESSDEEGKIIFDELEWGNYYIEEINPPEGYEKSDEKIEVEITRNSVEDKKVIEILEEQSKDVLFTLKKYESLEDGTYTQTPLKDCVFTLSKIKNGMETTIGRYITDENGLITLGPDIAYGSYKVNEVRTLKGYHIALPQTFELTPVDRQSELTFYNKRKTGSITLVVKDNHGNYVKDAEFTIYDENKENVIGTYKSDEDGIVRIDDLNWGKYKIIEEPIQGYEDNPNEIDAEINGENLAVILDILKVAKKGSVKLIKKDETETHLLEGAVFNLYDNTGAVIKSNLKTDSEGEILVEGLKWGSYYFKEIKAPLGYGINSEFLRFSINALNVDIVQEIISISVLDSKEITIVKKINSSDINFENGNPSFLFKLQGTDIHGKEHTYYELATLSKDNFLDNQDEFGNVTQEIIFTELIPGNYILSEEKIMRYKIKLIENVENGVLKDNKVEFDLINNSYGKAVFINESYENLYFSDTRTTLNLLKSSRKMTGLNINWNKLDPILPNASINKNEFTAIASFDDGSSLSLLGQDLNFNMEKYPSWNGEYDLEVSYTYKGIKKSTNFHFEITNGKERIVNLIVEPRYEGYKFEQNLGIAAEELNVKAVYSNGNELEIEPKNDEGVYNYSIEGTVPNREGSFDAVIKMNESIFGDVEQTIVLDADKRRIKTVNMNKSINNSYNNFNSNIGQVILYEDCELFVTHYNFDYDYSWDNNHTVSNYSYGGFPNLFEKSKIINVKIGDNITKIPSSAFHSCTSLTSVEIPNSVTSIGNDAFIICTSLTSVEIPEGVTSIANSAFYNCTSLTSIEIPEGVTSIGNQAFYSCDSLTSIEIPEGVTSIGNSAFTSCSSLTSIEIPEGVTSIGNSAFSSCKSLESIEIPNSVTSIGNSVFSSCSSLTSIEIPEGVTSIGNLAFYSCSSLESIEIPNSVISIGDSAFNSCSLLKSIEIPEGVTSIGSNLFVYCNKLQTIKISADLTTIGDGAFYYIQNLKEIIIESNSNFKVVDDVLFTADMKKIVFCLPQKQDTSYVIPNGVEEIAYGAFCNSKLQSIEIPNSVTSIGESAFYNCSLLESITIPNTITKIERLTFANCSSLKTLTIPNSITSIGSEAFTGCIKIVSLEVPNSVTSIGSQAFKNVNNVNYNGTATGAPWNAKSLNGIAQ